jgi:undecaprenyl-diphosphatase
MAQLESSAMHSRLSESMTELDRQLFLWVNYGLNSGFNDLWIGYATWLGNGWIAFPIAIVALLALDRRSFWVNLLALAASGIVGGIALSLIKNAAHSPRPLTVFASDIAAGRVYVNVMFERLYQNSFPSGHTQTAFTVATVLLWAYSRDGKLKWWNGAIIIALGTLIGVSRVYVGAHFPLDVLGGALLGAATAFPCCYLVGRWKPKH